MKIREGLTFDDVLLEPKLTTIAHRDEVSVSTSITGGLYPLKMPIISANMDSITGYEMALAMYKLGGLGIIHRFYKTIADQVNVVKCLKLSGVSTIAVSTGINNSQLDYAKLADAGANLFCLDVAHAHSTHVANHIKHNINELHGDFDFQVMAGNIATAEAVRMLLDCHINIFKVGIGPGSLCTTRIQTGCGVPQLTALDDVVNELEKYRGIYGVIADGGIRTSGDIVKALAIGANAVMIGRLFAGTDEAEMPNTYRGMASRQAQKEWKTTDPKYIEGESIEVPVKQGPVKNVVEKLIAGLRSGMSYTGSRNLGELKNNASFIRITNAGLIESHPHGKV